MEEQLSKRYFYNLHKLLYDKIEKLFKNDNNNEILKKLNDNNKRLKSIEEKLRKIENNIRKYGRN